jgi:hypothetical protein
VNIYISYWPLFTLKQSLGETVMSSNEEYHFMHTPILLGGRYVSDQERVVSYRTDTRHSQKSVLSRFPPQRFRNLDRDPCGIAMKMRKRGRKPVKV